jgi:hypothetical protein
MRRQLFVLASTVVLAVNAHAQISMSEPVARSSRGNWGLDVAVQIAQPVHEFATQIDRAWGVGSSIRHNFRGFTPLGLRGDFSFLNYGNERQRVPLSTTVNRVLVEMNTSNNIVVVSGGPELAVPRGAVRPYVHGFVGYSYFFTASTAGDEDGGGTFARSTNHDDGGLATGAGAGIRIPVHTRSTQVSIDGGARFTKNGVRSYLRSGDIIDLPDGSLAFTPRETNADYWVYYLGASFTFGRRR